ncbi:MAG TPA: CAP domain-containing protein [Ilumatobacteraceae bacterium]|nr:CAP domain-containing protein [Ilumatobacteraceae bacterium]
MRVRRSIVHRVTVAASIAAVVFAGQIPTADVVSAAEISSWLPTVNAYRAMSGLEPVTENTEWSAQAQAHACYLLYNDITHDEVPGNPGYTVGGDIAGNNGNVAVSSSATATARNHIDLWMTGPFHALGILRPKLATTGFGICVDETTPKWHSGATLDVLRGIDSNRASPTIATVFPGRNATLALDHFVTESPNPLTFCGWSGAAGLPLIAMMPGSVSSASATLVGPAGPMETCVLHGENTTGTAQSILRSDNAVVVVPRQPLAPGTYTSTVNTTGGNVTWSFTIDPNATLQPPSIDLPDTAPASARSTFEPVEPYRYADSRVSRQVVRLRAGVPTTVDIGGTDLTAVSANFTVASPSAAGFLTVYNCSAQVPTVSTLNFTLGAVPNQAVVPLSQGNLCLFSPADTEIIIDINGYFRAGSTSTSSGFEPLPPRRLYDTRPSEILALEPGVLRSIKVEGVAGGAPANANAVAVNLTVVAASDYGFVRAYACDQAGTSEVSNVNFGPLENRANSAIVPTSAAGTICVVSNAATDLLVDISGYFVAGGGLQFTPLEPVRLLDTRSPYVELNPATDGSTLSAGQVVRLTVAGTRGVPANAKAVSVNLTAAGSSDSGFVTAYPCGAVPTVSNLNFSQTTPAIANGALVRLSAAGELCLFTSNAVHLIVDINGVWF